MNCFPRDLSLSDLLYSTKRKTCYGNSNGGRRSTFAGNSSGSSELLPSDVIDFALLPAQRLLAGNTFIVRGHVTSKCPMRARAARGKIQLYNNEVYHSSFPFSAKRDDTSKNYQKRKD